MNKFLDYLAVGTLTVLCCSIIIMSIAAVFGAGKLTREVELLKNNIYGAQPDRCMVVARDQQRLIEEQRDIITALRNQDN